ncbi:hypothetical protein IscW_ISCW018974 [Ixodes scapularis]|uniref:Active regulator of SIRT1 n=1 Tax=Ixodes scapularis TaxID=6945 RepID=B7PMA3_IXOSC|nr:hypothetical protein IscW_ISCW018974 [Ixodes scapularis]|eukprot:XP_002434901.1 hypothetical protein IscW_ISCW018974 [Ixodes scapularis]
MSASLLRRALNLFDDLEEVKEKQKSKKAGKNAPPQKSNLKQTKKQQMKHRGLRKKALPNEEKRTRAIIGMY